MRTSQDMRIFPCQERYFQRVYNPPNSAICPLSTFSSYACKCANSEQTKQALSRALIQSIATRIMLVHRLNRWDCDSARLLQIEESQTARILTKWTRLPPNP
jgi:hypothetical protein